jgi:hypothetical protein
MPEEGLISERTPTHAREIRDHIGGRLRSYFAATQQMPLPAELADLIQQLSQETAEQHQE